MKRKIPQYVDEMVDSAVSRLKNLQNENTVNFAFITDTHNCTDYTERALYAIEEINKQVPVSFTCLGGDYLCNNINTTHEQALAQHGELGNLVEKYRKKYPLMVINGNHDCNAFGNRDNVVTPDEEYEILMKHHPEAFVCDPESPKSMYGYYDDEQHKIRTIFLDVMDIPYDDKGEFSEYIHSGCFGNKQLNWIAKTALRLPSEGWSVILFAHFAPIPNPFSETNLAFGGTALWEILCAFKNGTAYSASAKKGKLFYDVSCDFTSQGKCDIIGMFTGHYHCDWPWKSDGINIISCLAAASDNFSTGICKDGTKHLKTRGSGEESAFTIFTIDKNSRKIFAIRCGAGPDFRLEY